jgi:hypothetical protein
MILLKHISGLILATIIVVSHGVLALESSFAEKASAFESTNGCESGSIRSLLIRPGSAVCDPFTNGVSDLNAQNGDVSKTVSIIKNDNNMLFGLAQLNCAVAFSKPEVLQGTQPKYGCAPTTGITCPPGALAGLGVKSPDPVYGLVVFPDGDVTITQCVTNFFNSIVEIQNEFNKMMQISSPCDLQTESLETNSAISDAFKQVTMVGYRYSNTAAYKTACQTNGGNYFELDLDLSCRGTTPGMATAIYVVDRPRCYGVGCTPADNNALLEKYTLRPTENLEMEKEPGTTVTCSGTITSIDSGVVTAPMSVTPTTSVSPPTSGTPPISDPTGGGSNMEPSIVNECKTETNALQDSSDIGSALNVLKPEIKKAGLFSRGTFKVNFGDRTALHSFEQSCTTNNGRFSVEDLMRVSCSTSSDTKEYLVEGFPACYGKNCTSPVSLSILGSLFAKKVSSDPSFGTQGDGSQWRCSVSSGALDVGAYWLASWAAVMGVVWMIII